MYLEEQIEIMIQYLRLKLQNRDWHGVADAAMDIRELEAKLSLQKQITNEPHSDRESGKNE